jgi:hypothetical protein
LKIDPSKQFSHYSENCFNFLTWQELTQDKRILLCSITRPQSRFISTYVQYLNIWSEVYKCWGIDKVYLITHDEKFNLLWVNNLARSIPVLGDVACEFVAELSQHCGLQHHSDQTLAKFWNYQALVNRGQLEKIYFQPMDNLALNVLKDTKNAIMARHVKSIEHLHHSAFFLRNHSELMEKILYYRLHPNTDLKNYLLTTAR